MQLSPGVGSTPPDASRSSSPLSRRAFVQAGLSAAAVITAGCSSASSDAAPTTSLLAGADEPYMRAGFPDGLGQGPSIIADTGTQRAIFAVSRGEGYLEGTDLPVGFDGTLELPDGTTQNVRLDVRSEQIPQHYLRLEFEPSQTGLHTLSIPWESTTMTAPFAVAAKADIPLTHPGDPMPALETPTTDDFRGVTQLCTRTPEACPFHDVTVAEALAQGRPIVLMVSTPAFCTSSICGPTLEILMNEAAAYPSVQIIHAEVYSDPSKLGLEPPSDLLSPTLQELQLTFEPSMLVADASGTVRRRLDAAMDRKEIADALALIA